MTARDPVGGDLRADAGAGRDAAISSLTGLICLAGVMNGVVASRLLGLDPTLSAALTIAFGLFTVVLAEGVPFALSRARARFDPDWNRIAVKLVGLGALFALIAAAYLAFPAFHASAGPLVAVLAPAWPLLLLGGVLLVALTDAVDPDPEDACHAFGLAMLGRPADRAAVTLFLRGWLVKLFFLPLMFSMLVGYFEWLDGGIPAPAHLLAGDDWVEWPVRFLYLVDVSVAALGYAATFRLFGWHVRQVETTVGGWAVCLVCYPPLNGAVLEAFFPYRSGAVWSDAMDPTGALGIVVGVVILALQLVYVGATIQFGPRFSNLTHRGLLTGGLYRFSRHPAYLSKNILWWLTFMPFLPGTGIGEAARRTVCLLCVNAIYLMRARAEERMLLEDPAYRDYHRGMERTALLSRLATVLRRG